jgi:hypothetical protein
MYAKSTDTARIAGALSFAVCGFGFAAAVNYRPDEVMTVFALGALLSLIAAFSRFVEHLVRVWFESQADRRSAFQFTLFEMMVLMVVVAVVRGLFRVLGWSTIGVIILVVLLLSCCVESFRLRPKSDKVPKVMNNEPIPMSTADSATNRVR